VPRLRDHERLADTNDACGLAQDDLDAARILVVASNLSRAVAGLDVVQANHASFRLRHDFLREDDDISILEVDFRCDELGEIVGFADLRQPFDRNDAQFVQGRPVRRMPACAL
jgi:hypothetical protein